MTVERMKKRHKTAALKTCVLVLGMVSAVVSGTQKVYAGPE